MQRFLTAKIKKALTKGGLVIVPKRQVGKTTAILQFIAEQGTARFALVVSDLMQRDYARTVWRKTFGDQKPPEILAFQERAALRGLPQQVIYDEWFLCGCPRDFYAAVGTPLGKVTVVD